MPRSTRAPALRISLAALALAAALASLTACARRSAGVAPAVLWVAGEIGPAFDPDGPPEPVRAALERLITRGLVEEDSSGRIVPVAAERFELSPDRRILTFHLRSGLRFTDGTRCAADDFRAALEGGLARTDHGTRPWLLGAVQGVDRVRAGRPLPRLGIETPNPETLVLRLTHPDSLLLARLALPGVSDVWKTREATHDWRRAIGLGPYRVTATELEREITLVRRAIPLAAPSGPDTLAVRFAVGAPRVRSLLRSSKPELVWPEPPGLLSEPLAAGYRSVARTARPARHLLLVMRADLPPTSKLATRHALAHALNHEEILAVLGTRGTELHSWLPGAPAFEFPRLDAGLVRSWMDRGKLGRSFHVVISYDADGAGAEVARNLQGQWSRLGIYAELKARRGEAARSDALVAASAHLLVVESQAPLADAASELATLVMPLRGPAVGGFRSGWHSRDFDAWIAPGGRGVRRPLMSLDPAAAQARLANELVVLPLAELPWAWIERSSGPPVAFHPRFGPGCSRAVTDAPAGR